MRFRLIALAVLTASGCTPYHAADRIEQLAIDAGYRRTLIQGGRFLLVVYSNSASLPIRRIHVYIEGDGTPWLRQHRIAHDPTPRNPLMLKLMRRDPSPSLYLGRPCYHGQYHQAPCNPFFWTHGRYSEAVVNSMAAALNSLLVERGVVQAVLIGHSGGGTLAMLLAARIPEARAVITLAANLDTDAWTAYHHYTPLFGSLNPTRQAPLPRNIFQLHLVGANDTRVPPQLIQQAVKHQYNARWMTVEGHDHHCCWEALWPSLLATLGSAGRSSEHPPKRQNSILAPNVKP